MDEKPFPDSFWRGISSKEFVYDGYVLASAFQFDKDVREDDFVELSINWNDSDEALERVLSQRKANGKIQFSVGAVKLSLPEVKTRLSMFMDRKQFSYERRPIEGNEFHGNLLMSSEISSNKSRAALITNALALVAGTNIVEQTNE